MRPYMERSKESVNIDALMGIRFIAALGVLAHHFISPYFKEFGPHIIYNLVFSGRLAVPLFFILSGFVLQLSLSNRPQENSNLGNFYFKRLIRIYPLFFFSLLLSANIGYNIIQQSPSFTSGILKLLSVVTMTQAFFPSTKMLWNFPAWFLTPLLVSYLVFPIISKYFRHNNLKRLACLWLVFSLIIILIPFTRNLLDNNSELVVALFQFSPIFPLFYFILGIISGEFYIYHNKLKDVSPNGLLTKSITSTLEILGYASFSALIFISCLDPFNFRESITAILCSIFVLFLSLNKGVIQTQLSHPVILKLAEASYAMYIIHFPVYMWIRKIYTSLFHIEAPELTFSFLLVYVVTTITLALLTYHFIEKKAAKMLTSLFRSKAK